MTTKLRRNDQIVNREGVLTDRSYNFFANVADQFPILGTGSPDGVILAKKGRFYIDENGTSGNILYVKRDNEVSGDKSKGWILV